MKQIFKPIIAFAVGILSCVSASAQHESEPFIKISDYYNYLLVRPLCGRVEQAIKNGVDYKGEVVIPGKYFSSYLDTYAMVDWIEDNALSGSASSHITSLYIPASATEYPTYHNDRQTLAEPDTYWDGSFEINDKENLKTIVYESPRPSFEDLSVRIIYGYPNTDGHEPPWTWEDYKHKSYTITPTFFRKNPFENCPLLKSIVVLDPDIPLHSIKGVLFKDYDEDQTLMAFPLGRTGAYSLPEPTYRIGPDAFPAGCQITSLTLPATLTEIMDTDAFSGLTSLTKVIANWMNPPIFFSPTFSEEQYRDCTLVVPEGTIPAYATTVPWSLFSNIVEQTSGIETPTASPKELTCDVYSLSGVRYKSCVSPRDWDEGLAPGIYILRMSDGSTIKKSLTR